MTIDPILDTHTAIVGASGAGKTVTAKGFVEQLLGDRRHVVVIDPTGAWWGMQSNAAGDGPGFAIPVIGGLHSEIAIEPGDGSAIASLVIEEGMSAIIDLSELHDEEDLRAFMLAFVERLRAKPPANLHLIVDEADEFCPQIAPDSVGYRLIRQMTWIAKRGRLRGFVLTAITQRPADVANSVLSQMQTIVAHRLILPHDQDAIDRYLKRHASKEVRAEVMGSLAALGRGERWIYSPGEARLERAVSPLLTTFDSSSTPVAGQERTVPRALGEIDVAAILTALGRGAGDDRDEPTPAPDGSDSRVTELAAELTAALRDRDCWRERADTRLAMIERARAALQASIDGEIVEPAAEPVAVTAPARLAAGTSESARPLGSGAREMLGLLVDVYPEGVSWPDLALLAVRSPQGGAMNVDRKALRDNGLVEERDGLVYAVKSTATWSAASLTRRPAPAELRESWSGKLGGVARAIIEHLGDRETGAARPAAIGAATGRATRGGSWNVALKALRDKNVAHLADGDLSLHRFLVEAP